MKLNATPGHRAHNAYQTLYRLLQHLCHPGRYVMLPPSYSRPSTLGKALHLPFS